ncbi:MAG: ATPase, partial [Rhodococcus sp. (in: high G+C Gram-positive bacteria)]
GTTLTFRHHLTTTDGLEDIGPGWEYYLDMLVSTQADGWSPSFDDYHPSQCGYYRSLSPVDY